MKTIIIDSNNLIHKNEQLKKLFLKDKKSAQLSLIETIKSRSGRGDTFIFVFDGHGESGRDVIFSKEDSADKVIRKLIENFTDHKKLKVVSSDKEITALAKVCGAEVKRSEDLWKELSKTASEASGKNINQNYLYDKQEKPERLSKKEIDEFRKHFS